METSAKDTINTENLFEKTTNAFIDQVNTCGRKNSDLTKRNTLVINVDKIEQRNKESCCS